MTFAQSALPFDDIRSLLQSLPGPDTAAAEAARRRNETLTKPLGSLGRLEELAEFIAAWQGRHPPAVDRPVVVVFAGNHGVVRHGVAAYPQEVTAQMVANFRTGGAAINQLCKAFGLGLKVFELALEVPTRDITEHAALEEAECVKAMAFGMEAIAGGADLLCVGEMGIGNTTIAAAVCAALYQGRGDDWVGPGTGVDAAGLKRKAKAVDKALALHGAHLEDPLQVLRRLGGRELAAMAGAILAARHNRIPVLLDGYVATSAAAVLHKLNPAALDHCLAAHCSAEPPHRALLERLGKQPILDLKMRLGEASGAALAAGILKAAVAVHSGMATFADAGVSGKSAP
jgi:nicotinate-nucleotide--dimethylbenzimidazole phosphoribosyltransferase